MGYSHVDGYVAALISVLFFGCSFLPVKKFKAGDGLFFQWCQCAGAWTVGLLLQLFSSSREFYPLAALGGAAWATGNVLCVTVIRLIGMGMGMLVWGMANLLMGWLAGHFGLFGIHKQTTNSDALNITGVCLCIVSMFVMFFVKPADQNQYNLLEDTFLPIDGAVSSSTLQVPMPSHLDRPELRNDSLDESESEDWMDKLSISQRRSLGFGLAVLAGILFGAQFLPAQYLIDHPDTLTDGISPNSDQSLDYVFSCYCGILLAGTTWFLFYAMCRCNHPEVVPALAFPAFISGLMWGIGCVGWFVANGALKFVVAFPIITTGPGLISTLIGILFFREIEGRRNYLILTLAFLLTGSGISCIVVSTL
eukprot:gb/GEZN01009251.1/.p1 GENE.gb/GEZN01009251.1/~~gb/GEZN01009251.1/.p1  ORF type:complete len:365 (+),score=40.57 gb/GEZN01009251.1/:79-1173(+)